MTRRFTDKLIRIMLGFGLLGSSTFAISFFRGCDEPRKLVVAKMLDVEEPL